MIKLKFGDVYLVKDSISTNLHSEYSLYKIKKISSENIIEIEKFIIIDYSINYRDCIYLCAGKRVIYIDNFLSQIKEKVPKIIWHKIIRRHIIKQKTNTYDCEQFKSW